MHLVAPLAAGITGAENGTAEFYMRGGTAPAVYFLDFEASVFPPDGIPTGIPVVLDSYGGAVVYVQGLTNVVVKNSGGAVVREFVAGDSDDSVEVRSQSFTGTSYSNGMSGPGAPTTLGSVLDGWVSSAGGVDWSVALPGGGTATIKTAIASVYGLVFNVRAHGAVGDGVANDTSPINIAISAAIAAGGGIVYFPPGTYRTTGGHSQTNMGNVSFIGAGPQATAIVLDNPAASRVFSIQPPSTADKFSIVANMRISASVNAGANIILINGNSKVILYNLHLDGTFFSDHMVEAASDATTEMMVLACVFILGPAPIAVRTQTIRRAIVRECKFVTPVTYTGTAVVSSRIMELTGCLFVNTATTFGTYSCVKMFSSTIELRVMGCKFLASGGATVTAIDIGNYDSTAQVRESDNMFGTGITAYAYTVSAGARGSNISLATRETRSIFITDNTAAPSLPIDQYGLVVLSSGLATTAIVFQATARPPDGAKGTIVVVRTNAATGTVQAGTNFLNAVATAAYGSGAACAWEYRSCTPASTPRMALTVDGRSVGTP